MNLISAAVIIGAYLLGCFSPGYSLVRRLRGIDIRTIGSRRTGAFNVARVLGGTGFTAALVLDVLKGVLALAAAQRFGLSSGAQLLAMAAVVAGHNFPAQLGFRGGNGLAAAAGALAVFDPRLALGLAALFFCSLPVLWLLKAAIKVPVKFYTPSKVTVAASPLLALALGREAWEVLGLAAIVGMILWTIRSNLRALALEEGANGFDRPGPP